MILCRIKDIGGDRIVYIEAITKEEEEKIDIAINNKNKIYLHNNEHRLDAKSIYLYGEIDLDNDDDLDLIDKYNLVNEDGNYIPCSFDYDNAETHTNEDGVVKQYPTTDPILWFKYCHCVIGKPKRIIVYKKTWK